MSPAWFAIWVSLGSVFPVPVQALSPQDGVCDRTAEIRDAIVSAVTGVTDCAEITETQLGQITTLTLFGVSITALAADDLVGLSGLVTLNLAYTGLTVLPPTVFEDLTSLDNLWLNNNQLQTLPAGIFTGLTGLDDLRLASNPGFPFGPVAEAGPSFFVSTDREVTLRGSGGSDPWGRSVTYAWTQSDSSGVVVSLDGDTTATPSLTAPAVEQETVFRFMLSLLRNRDRLGFLYPKCHCEGRSAVGTQRLEDGGKPFVMPALAPGSWRREGHGASLPVMRASAREEMRRISLTIRSSSRLFAIHSRYRTSSSSVSFKPTVFPRALRVQWW